MYMFASSKLVSNACMNHSIEAGGLQSGHLRVNPQDLVAHSLFHLVIAVLHIIAVVFKSNVSTSWLLTVMQWSNSCSEYSFSNCERGTPQIHFRYCIQKPIAAQHYIFGANIVLKMQCCVAEGLWNVMVFPCSTLVGTNRSLR